MFFSAQHIGEMIFHWKIVKKKRDVCKSFLNIRVDKSYNLIRDFSF
jgi:hypothetical protein